MANDSVPYLCGGIFFALLIQVKYEGTARVCLKSQNAGHFDKSQIAAM